MVPAVGSLSVCSFNIQFLGTFANRSNTALAQLLRRKNCDLVVIQELVAPPSEKFLARNHLYTFPPLPGASASSQGGERRMFPLSPLPGATPEPIRPAERSTEFFEAMAQEGFTDFVLSEEDTGATDNHTNGTASEWWVTFFDPKKLEVAADLPHGFLSDVRVGPKPWERTPYAFPFRTKDHRLDFVLISVHLAPEARKWKRRQEELGAIRDWVDAHSETEKDFLTLGDMNIEDAEELAKALPRHEGEAISPWTSLNAACVPTNTLPSAKSARPYDHVLFDPRYTTSAELDPGFEVIRLREEVREDWERRHPGEAFPGGELGPDGIVTGYDHLKFRTEYSDHNPVRFTLQIPETDDDSSGQ